ncbi:MAG: quinone-dependent dihydroorotate dehydrogenase [Chitinophagales bacterium]|nr:quinone-dependent dihydroorotate dehydrogenase [Hyphomicrobiales bacterium]
MIEKLFSLAQPGLFLLDPERAHELTLQALERGVFPRGKASDAALRQTFWGLDFPNPIGMAAGFDKDARVPDALLAIGFGFTEIGTVTPRPQPGNPRPRVFRLVREGALINRLGFNGGGHAAARERLVRRARRGVVGVNIGANKDAPDPVENYAAGVRAFADCASYLTVNISSPNTPGLRGLQAPEKLDSLLERVLRERDFAKPGLPVLVKLAPDLDEHALPDILDLVMARSIDGLILTNTTIERNGIPYAAHRGETGGLSGRPLFARSTRFLAKVYLLTDGKIPLIGVGGVDSGEAALQKILAGASLIQLYTGLIYQGPALLGQIRRTLGVYLQSEDLTLKQAIGCEAGRWAETRL